MKILVCTDGSEHSKKALERAATIAEGCYATVNDLAIIHVYDHKLDLSALYYGGEGSYPTQADVERFRELLEEQKLEREKILQDALKYFEEKGLKARTIFKEGKIADTILKIARDEKFDMIVLGSRGLGGLKKMFLGSVSSSVVQEAENCTVSIVK